MRDLTTIAGFFFAASLAWRSTPWLRFLDVVGLFVSLALVSDISLRARSLRSSDVVRSIFRPVVGLDVVVRGFGRDARDLALRTGRRVNRGGRFSFSKLLRVARGATLAVPVVIILGTLLVSADGVFASLFHLPTPPDLTVAVGHLVVIVFVAGLLICVVAGGSVRTERKLVVARTRIGRTESTMILGAVNILFAVFAATQFVAIVRGDRYVLQTSGLTYAEYARSGFFQLVAVACLTLAVIGVVRRLSGEVAFAKAVRAQSVVTCVLTVVITAVAFRRLTLYERAYGITVARVVAHAGIISIGLVLSVVAVGSGRSGPGRDLRGWVTSFGLAICTVAVLALHVVNPSAWAARSALQRPHSVEQFAKTDDDGLPVLASRLTVQDVASATPGERLELRSAWCSASVQTSWVGANLAALRARQARASLCRLVS